MSNREALEIKIKRKDSGAARGVIQEAGVEGGSKIVVEVEVEGVAKVTKTKKKRLYESSSSEDSMSNLALAEYYEKRCSRKHTSYTSRTERGRKPFNYISLTMTNLRLIQLKLFGKNLHSSFLNNRCTVCQKKDATSTAQH